MASNTQFPKFARGKKPVTSLQKPEFFLVSGYRFLVSKTPHELKKQSTNDLCLSPSARILVTRTDRIGDVVLSTPVFQAIKEKYPNSFLAAMVLKETQSLVCGNPRVDEVIVYDKKGREKSWLRTFFFGLGLRKKGFDLVIHLHPTNRVNLLSILAGIPIRIGYRRKNYILLTHSLEEKKWQGKRHEAECNFDLLALIGVPMPEQLEFHVPLSEKDRKEDRKGVRSSIANWHWKLSPQFAIEDLTPFPFRYAVFHPSASGRSKIWPSDRFARVADELVRRYALLPVIVGEGAGVSHAAEMESKMTEPCLNLAGKLTLGELAWLLRDARLLISNDSGPVHVANALGTPVISIFGRSEPGLSHTRWRPYLEPSSYLHKDVGCVECLAEHCQIGFKCLTELRPEEVLEEVKKYEPFLIPSHEPVHS